MNTSKLGIALFVATVIGLLSVSFYFYRQTILAQSILDKPKAELVQSAEQLQASATELASAAPSPEVKMVRRKVGQTPVIEGSSVVWKDIWIEVAEVTVSDGGRKNLEAQFAKSADEVHIKSKALEAADKRVETKSDRLAERKQVVAAIVSLVVLMCSLYAIFFLPTKGHANVEKWAFASIGTILGHWLSNV